MSKSRLIHYRENGDKRVVTIAYCLQKLDDKPNVNRLDYGATIWRQTSLGDHDRSGGRERQTSSSAGKPKDTFTKDMRKKSNSTAFERLEKNPVTIYVKGLALTWSHIKYKLREAVHTFGVRSHPEPISSIGIITHGTEPFEVYEEMLKKCQKNGIKHRFSKFERDETNEYKMYVFYSE